mmetsp:Transcript_24383/g.70344  ORF Transcript_24383/g.70344 Transcript_24383/m.70344 type:complete len:340 (+) Transcript_24383:36-1055(+)
MVPAPSMEGIPPKGSESEGGNGQSHGAYVKVWTSHWPSTRRDPTLPPQHAGGRPADEAGRQQVDRLPDDGREDAPGCRPLLQQPPHAKENHKHHRPQQRHSLVHDRRCWSANCGARHDVRDLDQQDEADEEEARLQQQDQPHVARRPLHEAGDGVHLNGDRGHGGHEHQPGGETRLRADGLLHLEAQRPAHVLIKQVQLAKPMHHGLLHEFPVFWPPALGLLDREICQLPPQLRAVAHVEPQAVDKGRGDHQQEPGQDAGVGRGAHLDPRTPQGKVGADGGNVPHLQVQRQERQPLRPKDERQPAPGRGPRGAAVPATAPQKSGDLQYTPETAEVSRCP